MDLTRRLLWLALVLVMTCSMLAAPGVGIGPETLYTQTLKTNSTKAGWQKALSISTNITDIGTNVSFQGNANISGSYLSFRDTNVITTGVSASLSPAIFLTNALANSFAFGLKDINGNTFEMRIDAAGNSGTFYHAGAIFLSGGGKTVDVAAGGFAPGTDADTDLGGPTFRWKDIYSTGALTAGSVNATTNLSGSTATLGSVVITNGVTSNGATNTGIWDMPATALQTMAPGSAVTVNGYAHRVVGSNSVATVLTSTPEVATNNINDGTQIVILGTSDTATVTLNDSRTTAGAGSALLMRSPIMALYNGGVIGFRYSTNINRWKELFRSENGSQVSEFANAKVYTNLTVNTVLQPIIPLTTTNINWALGNLFSSTVSSNSTWTFSGATAGQMITVKLRNAGATAYTVTWPTIRWKDGVTPTLRTNASDFYTLFYWVDSSETNYYGSAAQNY